MLCDQLSRNIWWHPFCGNSEEINSSGIRRCQAANGFTVYDLGRDVKTDTIIEEAQKVDADVIGTSALLTTTMTKQRELEEALKKAGLMDQFKTIVGGAPVTARWAARIDADAWLQMLKIGLIKHWNFFNF